MNYTKELIEKEKIQKPLDVLIQQGNLPLLDSVAFGSLLNHNLGMSNDEAKHIIKNVMHNNPFFTSTLDTSLGRIGLITLPVLYEEIYFDAQLINYIQKGITLSKSLGARCISLTDLIPSATNYGNDISINEENILLSTGHGATVSAMVLNIDNVLEITSRNIELETIVFVGLGSIGTSTLELMLSVLKHPKKLILCDVFNKAHKLKEIYKRIFDFYKFKGEVLLVNPTGLDLPTRIYQEGSIIIGATNIPNLVITSNLKPGTIIIDDSSPHVFDVDSCLKRVHEKQDIIVIHGGILTMPKPISLTVDYRLERYLKNTSKAGEYRYEIMGCILGSILPLVNDKLSPTIGLLKPEVTTSYYNVLKEKGITSSALQCENYYYSRSDIEKFTKHLIHF